MFIMSLESPPKTKEEDDTPRQQQLRLGEGSKERRREEKRRIGHAPKNVWWAMVKDSIQRQLNSLPRLPHIKFQQLQQELYEKRIPLYDMIVSWGYEESSLRSKHHRRWVGHHHRIDGIAELRREGGNETLVTRLIAGTKNKGQIRKSHEKSWCDLKDGRVREMLSLLSPGLRQEIQQMVTEGNRKPSFFHPRAHDESDFNDVRQSVACAVERQDRDQDEHEESQFYPTKHKQPSGLSVKDLDAEVEKLVSYMSRNTVYKVAQDDEAHESFFGEGIEEDMTPFTTASEPRKIHYHPSSTESVRCSRGVVNLSRGNIRLFVGEGAGNVNLAINDDENGKGLAFGRRK